MPRSFEWPRQCSAAMVAEALGVSRASIASWPCPRNSDNTYSLPDVMKWRLAEQRKKLEGSSKVKSQDDDPDDRRWKKARADERQLDLAERVGLVVRRSVVESEWERLLTSLNTSLQGLGKALGPKLVGMTEAEAAAAVDSAVYDAVQQVVRAYQKQNEERAASS